MNCKLCNQNNKEYYNYCLNDGSYLRNFKNAYLIKNNVSKKCNICDTHNRDYYNYCIECGNKLYNFSK